MDEIPFDPDRLLALPYFPRDLSLPSKVQILSLTTVRDAFQLLLLQLLFHLLHINDQMPLQPFAQLARALSSVELDHLQALVLYLLETALNALPSDRDNLVNAEIYVVEPTDLVRLEEDPEEEKPLD